jgi:Zn-dependent protease
MFGKSYRLPFRLLGIPVLLDISFLIILPLLAWVIGRQVGAFAHMFGLPNSAALHSGYMPYVLGLIAAIGLFVCVVLHELGHAVVARMYGVNVKNITLWFLGGVAQFGEIPRRPGAEAVVAIAGPIVSLAIAAICWAVLHLVPIWQIPVQFIFAYLIYMNVVLAIFNLIPAMPMDGGRVLRSILALWMPRPRATMIAAGISKVLAVMMGLFGLISFNFFILLIAIFIFMAVQSETSMGQMEQMLRGFEVADAMNSDVGAVSPEVRVTDLAERMFREHRLAFPVTDSEGHLLGMVSADQMQGKDPFTPISQVMVAKPPTIPVHARIFDAFRSMSESGFDRIAAVDDTNHLVGVVTKTDLLRLLRLRALGLAPHS